MGAGLRGDNGSVLEKKFHIEKEEPNATVGFTVAKRIFDIIASVIVLTVLLVPMLIISLIIKLDSKGPVIFKQERLGKDAKPFTMYKFRTMRADAEDEVGPKWADKNDSRCTKVGAFLRKTRLDELPQFANILRGDMSVVGPRPEREFFYKEFESYIDGFDNRLAVLPGLTGLAQINGGYDLKPEEKIVYDMEYIRTQSISLDVKCLLGTVGLFFTQNGAR